MIKAIKSRSSQGTARRGRKSELRAARTDGSNKRSGQFKLKPGSNYIKCKCTERS